MCTSILMNAKKALFGRNMDIDFPLSCSVVITPRRFPFPFRLIPAIKEHYAIIGMGMVRDNYPLYFEAANECGLAAAGLNFPGNAFYDKEACEGKTNISPFELIPYLLSQCNSLAQARELLSKIHLTDINFSSDMPLSPLHWHIASCEGSIVYEVTRDGARIYDNTANVMTNNPTFDFHLKNLGNYLNLTPKEPCGSFSEAGVNSFAAGLGSVGLPGDFSSPSRFVKSAYLLENTMRYERESADICQMFHILSSVEMVKGSVINHAGVSDITVYSACIDLDEGIYCYRTYDNSTAFAVDMKREKLDTSEPIIYPVSNEERINIVN